MVQTSNRVQYNKSMSTWKIGFLNLPFDLSIDFGDSFPDTFFFYVAGPIGSEAALTETAFIPVGLDEMMKVFQIFLFGFEVEEFLEVGDYNYVKDLAPNSLKHHI